MVSGRGRGREKKHPPIYMLTVAMATLEQFSQFLFF